MSLMSFRSLYGNLPEFSAHTEVFPVATLAPLSWWSKSLVRVKLEAYPSAVIIAILHVVKVHHIIPDGIPLHTVQLIKCMICNVTAKSRHFFALPTTIHNSPDLRRKLLHQVGTTLLGRTVHGSTYPINAELRNPRMIRLPSEVVVVTSVESKKVLMVTSSERAIGSERCVRFSRTSARVIERAHQWELQG